MFMEACLFSFQSAMEMMFSEGRHFDSSLDL